MRKEAFPSVLWLALGVLSWAACTDPAGGGTPVDAAPNTRRDTGASGDDDAGEPGTDASIAPEGGLLPVTCVGDKHTPGGPDAWGGCWPGEHNTGVPSGTTLTPYTGPCTITQDGTVIDAMRVDCNLAIRAANVRITRSEINGSVATDEELTGYSFTISDSNVNVGERAGTGVGAVDFTAQRVHVRGGNRSMHCWRNCTITDSYVHGQFRDSTGVTHESGMRMGAGATIRHNAIICDAPEVPPDAGCSADLTGYGDFAPVENNTINRNLFGASTGGFCTYGGSTAGKPFSNDANHIVFTNNIWQRGNRPSDHGEFVCGYYGSNTGFDPARPGNVWTNNRFDDGTPIESSN